MYLSLIVEIASSNLRISACRTAERSERMSFVSLARSASVPPPTGVALVTTFFLEILLASTKFHHLPTINISLAKLAILERFSGVPVGSIVIYVLDYPQIRRNVFFVE